MNSITYSSGLTVNAYYYPGYHQGHGGWRRGRNEFNLVRYAKPLFDGHVIKKPVGYAGVPAYFRHFSSAILQSQTRLAHRFGIDNFIFNFYMANDGTRYCERPLDTFRRLSDTSGMGFAVNWCYKLPKKLLPVPDSDLPGHDLEQSEAWRQIEVNEDYFKKVIDYLCKNYFRSPRYLKFNDQPVVYLYNLKDIFLMHGGDIQKFNDCLLEGFNAAIVNGFKGIFYIGILPHWDGIVMQDIWRYNVDCVTGYSLLPDFNMRPLLQDYGWMVQRRLLDWYSFQMTFDINSYWLPTVVTGWDSSPRGARFPGLGIPAFEQRGNGQKLYPWFPIVTGSNPGDFLYWLREAGMFMEQNKTPRIINLSAWNEWSEGCALEPNNVDGCGYLRAVQTFKSEPSVCVGIHPEIKSVRVDVAFHDGEKRNYDLQYGSLDAAARLVFSFLSICQGFASRPETETLKAAFIRLNGLFKLFTENISCVFDAGNLEKQTKKLLAKGRHQEAVEALFRSREFLFAMDLCKKLCAHYNNDDQKRDIGKLDSFSKSVFIDSETVRHAISSFARKTNSGRNGIRITQIRCMDCSVVRNLGLRGLSDFDGLVVYYESAAGHRPSKDVLRRLKNDLKAKLESCGIIFGADLNPLEEPAFVEIRDNRIFGHPFVADGTIMPLPDQEPYSKMALLPRVEACNGAQKTQRRNLSSAILSQYYKQEGVSKLEARLRLAVLIRRISGNEIVEALCFREGTDPSKKPAILEEFSRRMSTFIAHSHMFSLRGMRLFQTIHSAMLTGSKQFFISRDDENNSLMNLCALAELIKYRLIKVSPDMRHIIPMWNLETSLEIDDERRAVSVEFESGKEPGTEFTTAESLLSMAQAAACVPETLVVTSVERAEQFLTQEERFENPFLRDRSVKVIGGHLLSETDAARRQHYADVLFNILGDRYELAVASAISCLKRAGEKEISLRTIALLTSEEAASSPIKNSNLINLLGQINYGDPDVFDQVVTFLTSNYGVIFKTVREKYNVIYALGLLNQQQHIQGMRQHFNAFAERIKTNEGGFLRGAAQKFGLG